ncbi:MAG: glycerophosphodiester phosphodiesterase [Proteobacteria bacterium]|nr:glycerophosphodiester phosphodiesterase [Pseudomonadota bacterium]
MMRLLRWAALVVLLFAAFCFFNNTNMLATPSGAPPTLLAHRGLAQTFHREALTNSTCTATRIDPPEHPYLENTIASMQAAFADGAGIVEFDVQPTTDGGFAIFHDWTLDCRTDGHGPTREHSLAELKKLDIGYGYTADNGRTFPFRGKGVGLMPSLDEVLAAFPDKRFLIDVKSNDPTEGERLAARLAALTPQARARLMIYGGDKPIEAIHDKLPDVAAMSKHTLKECAVRYTLFGWSGFVPKECRHTLIILPSNFAPFAWGWPHKLVARLRHAGSIVLVAGPYDGGNGTSGIDDAAQFKALPQGYDGGIWTNRVDRIAPLVRR